MSNGHLERLKLTKTNRRTCLGEDTLDQLIRINVEGPPLSEWDAGGALELWTKEKVRRLNHKDEYRERCEKSTVMSNSESEDEARFSLEDWENWIT